MYRMPGHRPLVDVHALAAAQGRSADLLAAEDGRIPVAVAIRLDPVMYSASAPFQQSTSFILAGFLRGEPVVPGGKALRPRGPADADFVLEGHVSKDALVIEGPFGDHTGYYSHAEPLPIFGSRR